MNSTYFYRDKPILGLDIGFNSVKAMQIERRDKQQIVVGYGVGGFDNQVLKDGAIVDPVSLAKSINELFKNKIIGEINTRRVAVGIPATRTFTRSMNLPSNIRSEELTEAVTLEAEQYIPVSI